MNSLSVRLPSRRMAGKLMIRFQCSASARPSQEIQIPNRIHRDPTDVLKALAGTVGRDATAAHYKYHDDPYLIPMSNVGKRTFALSQEAGRKAAIWIRQQHPTLFQQKLSDPVISAFLPKAMYRKSELSEDVLMDAIKESRLSDALRIHTLLKNEVISMEAKQALLELICFCNNEEPLPEELIEERWYRQMERRQRNTWKDNNVAAALFAELKEQGDAAAAAAYNALICGTAKYIQVDKTWTLYEECRGKGLPLNVHTYNALLRLVPLLREGGIERKSLMMNLLGEMKKIEVKPNINTLNACLKVASSLKAPNPGRDTALSILKDMTTIDIEPSLASYYYLLITFCRQSGPVSGILVDILNQLEGKEFGIRDPEDVQFFVNAMSIARYHLGDQNVAHRVHKLLLTGNNYDLIGDSYKESVYYRHYFTLLVTTEPLEEFMKLYDFLVPHVYIPEPSVMEEVICAVELAGVETAGELLPRLWSQMVIFDHAARQPLVIRVLQAMHTNCALPPESPLHEKYATIAWDIWNRIQDQSNLWTKRIAWTGGMLGNVAVLSLRGGYFERALEVMGTLEKDQATITGTPTIENLSEILDACINNGHVRASIGLIQYAAESGFSEAGLMGRKLASTLSLNSSEEAKLINLLGKDVLQLNLTNN